MEDTNLNPISGEQVPIQELSTEPTMAQVVPAQAAPNPPLQQPASAKEIIIEKKMNTLKRSILILGAILVMLLIALVSVLALLANKPVNQPFVPSTPIPTVEASIENENIPKEIVSGVKRMEERVNTLDIEENELSFPKLDWKINY